MSVILTRLNGFLFKTEGGTPGVDAVPTGANDAILTLGPPEVTPNPDVQDPDLVQQALDAADPYVATLPMQCVVKVPLHGSGVAADTPPEFSPLLQACGFAETVNAGVSVVYELASTGFITGTAYIYKGGLLWKLLGCRGSWDLEMVSSQFGVLTFTLHGLLGGKTDVALPALTFDDAIPPKWKAATMTIGGAAAAVQQLTLNSNNNIYMPPDPNAAEGLQPAEITGRSVQGSINPLETLVATRDIFTDFKSGTAKALQAKLGTAGGNRITVDITAAKYRGETQRDDSGVQRVDVPFSATGKDDTVMTLTFD